MLRRYLTVLLTALGLIAAVNGVMDPFDVLGAPHIAGFNDRKSPGNDRFFRPLQVSARQPKTVFLGNSRIANALDPSSFPQLDAYNLAVPAATMIEEVALTCCPSTMPCRRRPARGLMNWAPICCGVPCRSCCCPSRRWSAPAGLC